MFPNQGCHHIETANGHAHAHFNKNQTAQVNFYYFKAASSLMMFLESEQLNPVSSGSTEAILTIPYSNINANRFERTLPSTLVASKVRPSSETNSAEGSASILICIPHMINKAHETNLSPRAKLFPPRIHNKHVYTTSSNVWVTVDAHTCDAAHPHRFELIVLLNETG